MNYFQTLARKLIGLRLEFMELFYELVENVKPETEESVKEQILSMINLLIDMENNLWDDACNVAVIEAKGNAEKYNEILDIYQDIVNKEIKKIISYDRGL